MNIMNKEEARTIELNVSFSKCVYSAPSLSICCFGVTFSPERSQECSFSLIAVSEKGRGCLLATVSGGVLAEAAALQKDEIRV